MSRRELSPCCHTWFLSRFCISPSKRGIVEDASATPVTCLLGAGSVVSSVPVQFPSEAGNAYSSAEGWDSCCSFR